MPTVTELRGKISIDVSGYTAAIDTANRATESAGSGAAKTKDAVKDLEKQLDSSAEKAQRLGGILSVGLTAPIIGFGAASTRSAMQMEGLRRGLISVSGSAEAADAQLKSLREASKLPGLGFQEAVLGSTRLQAVGYSAEMAERTMKAFGNALAATGGGPAELQGVVVALSQIEGKGKVSAEEINQIAERLPSIRKAMKEAFGTADTEVLQKMNMSTQEFTREIVEYFEKISPVAEGAKESIEELSTTMFINMARAGEAILPFVVMVTNQAVPAIEFLGSTFKALPDPVKNFMVGTAALLAVIGPGIFVFGTLVKTLKDAREGWGALTKIGPQLVAFFTGNISKTALETKEIAANTREILRNTDARSKLTKTGAVGGVTLTGTAAKDAADAARAKTPIFSSSPLPWMLGGAAVEMGKQFLPDNDSGMGKRGGAGFLGDMLAGGLTGAGLGTMAAPGVGTVAGAVIGAGVGAYSNISGGADRQKSEMEQAEKEAVEHAKAASEKVRAARNQTKTVAAEDTKQVQEAANAAYEAQITQAKALAGQTAESQRAQAELAAIFPVIKARQDDLIRQANALRPTIDKNAEDREAYYKLQKEAWDLEGQYNSLSEKARKEIEDAAKKQQDSAKKQLEQQRRLGDMRFEAQQQQAESLAGGYGDNRAQATAALVTPVLQQRQRELVAEAQKLRGQANTPEAQERYLQLYKEYYDLQSKGIQLQVAAQNEIKRLDKESQKEEENLYKQRLEIHQTRAEAMIKALPEEEQTSATILFLRSEQQRLIEIVNRDVLTQEQYNELSKEYWELEGKAADKQGSLLKERESAAKEALDKAKKTRDETLRVQEATFKLAEARMKNENPLMSEEQRSRRLIPLLAQQFKTLLQPVEGETQLEGLNRQIDAQGIKGQIIESLGMGKKGFGRTRRGGMIPFHDVRQNAGILQQIAQMEQQSTAPGSRDSTQAARALARDAAAGRPVVIQVVLDPNATREQQMQAVMQVMYNMDRQRQGGVIRTDR